MTVTWGQCRVFRCLGRCLKHVCRSWVYILREGLFVLVHDCTCLHVFVCKDISLIWMCECVSGSVLISVPNMNGEHRSGNEDAGYKNKNARQTGNDFLSHVHRHQVTHGEMHIAASPQCTSPVSGVDFLRMHIWCTQYSDTHQTHTDTQVTDTHHLVALRPTDSS